MEHPSGLKSSVLYKSCFLQLIRLTLTITDYWNYRSSFIKLRLETSTLQHVIYFLFSVVISCMLTYLIRFNWSFFILDSRFLSYIIYVHKLLGDKSGWQKVSNIKIFVKAYIKILSSFLKDLTSNALKQRNNTDLCLSEDSRTAGRRCANHGIVSRNMKKCSAACCTSKEPFFSISNIWKGRRDIVIALAVINTLSSFRPAPVTCGKGASNLII